MSHYKASRRFRFRVFCLGSLLLMGAVATTQVFGGAEEGDAGAPREQSLEQCIQLGLQHQPALAAARASLAAAYSGERGLNNIRFGALLARDLPIRRQQACLGVQIASAGLEHAEWETRYAVRRTFYSIKYAKMQLAVVKNALTKIDDAIAQAKKLVDAGDPKILVTKLDVDVLKINKAFVATKYEEAAVGVSKAIAGLREAIGVNLDFPLDPADEPLPPWVDALDKAELISQARANRSELAQAMSVNRVTELEIEAQARKWFGVQVPTFAAGSDIHAKQIPQGVANGEYRPGAIGPEMPTFLIGPRGDRMQRAADLNERSVAVVDKTENLITLEIEAIYLQWLQASRVVKNLEPTPDMSRDVAELMRKRFNEGNVTGREYLEARTLEEQSRAQYNQALFHHALALAALERATAGGYRIPATK